jgi:hypothetical protein
VVSLISKEPAKRMSLNQKLPLSRRDFLKLGLLTLGSLGLRPWRRLFTLADFPKAERLGRIAASMVDIKVRPDEDSQTIGVLYEDAIVPWLQEIIGPRPFRVNQRWVETPDGYICSPPLFSALYPTRCWD